MKVPDLSADKMKIGKFNISDMDSKTVRITKDYQSAEILCEKEELEKLVALFYDSASLKDNGRVNDAI